MALRDIDDKGRMRELTDLDYRRRFDEQWARYTAAERQVIIDAIGQAQ